MIANPELFLAALVDADLRAAGVPIDGVSIGATADRATWTPRFSRAPTQAERDAAAAAIAGFDMTTLAARATALVADNNAAPIAIAAMIAYIWRLDHAGANPTGAQLQAELTTWKAIYRTLS